MSQLFSKLIPREHSSNCQLICRCISCCHASIEEVRWSRAAHRCRGRSTCSVLRVLGSRRCDLLHDPGRRCCLMPPPRKTSHSCVSHAQIRALCTTVRTGQLGAKFGVAALPRHLRRRAGSHKPYHNHRFRPNAKLESKRRKVDSDTAEDGKAAAAGDARPAAAEDASIEPRFTNRRMRRQPAALQERIRQTAAWTEGSLAACAGAATNGSSSGDAAAGALEAAASSGTVRRLETHVWHAKRLAMEQRYVWLAEAVQCSLIFQSVTCVRYRSTLMISKLRHHLLQCGSAGNTSMPHAAASCPRRYGWLLPAGAPGQGRNSRSFVHVTKASSLMHDASYLCPLLLRCDGCPTCCLCCLCWCEGCPCCLCCLCWCEGCLCCLCLCCQECCQECSSPAPCSCNSIQSNSLWHMLRSDVSV
jgi:hypothetical protein